MAAAAISDTRKTNSRSASGHGSDVRGNLLVVDKIGLPEAMLNRLNRLAAFQNPEFYKAQAMRLPTYDKPRVICCVEEFPQCLALPRGLLDEVLLLLKQHQIKR